MPTNSWTAIARRRHTSPRLYERWVAKGADQGKVVGQRIVQDVKQRNKYERAWDGMGWGVLHWDACTRTHEPHALVYGMRFTCRGSQAGHGAIAIAIAIHCHYYSIGTPCGSMRGDAV